MESYGHEMIWMVKMLTSNNTDELAPRDTSRELRIPSHVTDLIYFGRAAGEAADLIAKDDIASIKEYCPGLSKLAAIVASDDDFFNVMNGYMVKPIAHIVAALNTQELLEHWKEDELAHQDLIETITWVAATAITRRLFIEMAISAVVNATENHADLTPETVTFALRYMSETACSILDTFAPAYMHAVKETVISIVKTGENFDDSWKGRAVHALASIDFDAEVRLTQENEQLADEVLMLVQGDTNPRNVAITVGWLAAIYRYTPYRDRFEEFFDLEILDIESEDHQEDVDDESPDGLAA